MCLGSIPRPGTIGEIASGDPDHGHHPMILQAWRSKQSGEYGIRIGEVDVIDEELTTAKPIRIDLDGVVHTFKLTPMGYGGKWAVVSGEQLREWPAKRGALDGAHPDRPVFHLMEMMVPLGEKRQFKLWG